MRLYKDHKENRKTNGDNYILFSDWLDRILGKDLPHPVIALNFNLYEGADQTYDIQLIGSDEFDKDDADWACSEVFTTGEDICFIPRTKDIHKWEDGLALTKELIKKYLAEGKYSSRLKKYDAIGVGFVDGDLEIIYLRQ